MDLTKLTSDEFDRFRVFIYEETGIRLADGKITLLSNRIRRRLRELDIELFEEYWMMDKRFYQFSLNIQEHQY